MIGRTLKHYEVEEALGNGGMGVVYRARDTRLERPVAIKLLKPELVADPDRKSRFLREARAAAAVSHPAIAQVYDIDEDGGTTFIAMEFVDGRTVGRLIAQGELDLLGSVEIALQIAEGLAKAHEANIIHRDIKSDNIMVTREGHAKLLDFGIAKLLDASAGDTELDLIARSDGWTMTAERARTLPGAVVGTVPYMSPEQARGQALDPRSDIFSLGIVLYEMVTGELPFKGDSLLDTMHAIVFEEPKPVTALRRNLPPKLHMIVARCLRKRREDRYPDAHALAADLKHLKHDLDTGTTTSLPVGARLRGWLERINAALPFGRYGTYVVAGAILVAAALLFTNLQLGNMFTFVVIGFFLYRFLRNRKRRILAAVTKKISAFPEVMAVAIKGDRVTVVVAKAPAKTYIRITSLIDSANRRLFFGKDVTGEIRDDVADKDLRTLLRQPGVTYIRDDITLD
jgi:tRNA A-37 threonylcarbamoyl transferase component Bud32